MATHNITISSVNPVQLLTTANKSISMLANLDAANSVWLSSDAGGSAGAIELTAGSTLSWDSLTALYAYVPVAGQSVKLLVLDSGGVFNNGIAVANALAASGLTAAAIAASIQASGLTPGAIADEITLNGLTPAAIAAQITASGLTPGAIATETNLAGVPSIDVPVTIATAVALSENFTTPTYDVRKYQSIYVSVSQAAAASTVSRGIVARFLNLAGAVISETVFYTAGQLNASGVYGDIMITIPVVGSHVNFYVASTGVAFNGTINSITASYRTQSPRYTCSFNGMSYAYAGPAPVALASGNLLMIPKLFAWQKTNAASFGAFVYNIQASESGRARLVAANENGTGTLHVGILNRVSNTWIVPLRTIVGGQVSVDEFILGNYPIDIYIGGTSLVGVARIDLAMGY